MKKIFITGGTSGIGLALAKHYLAQGHFVGLCGRDTEKIKKEFPFIPDNLAIYTADVCDRELLRKVVQEFADGELDIMVANAGVSMPNKTPIPDFTQTREVMNINIFGVLNAFEAAIEIMLKQKKEGQLVAIASVAGFVGLPGTAAYCASKAAVLKLCETFAIDLKNFGIHVTAIAPGFIDTPLTKKNRHSMPFIMSAEKSVYYIAKAIEKKQALMLFPLPMALIILFLYHIPRGLYRWLVGKFYGEQLKNNIVSR